MAVRLTKEQRIAAVKHYYQSNENGAEAVSYTHLRAHETRHDLVCRLLLASAPFSFD